MGGYVTFQLVYALAALAAAWLAIRYWAARAFTSAFGLHTAFRCFPAWMDVVGTLPSGESVTVKFLNLSIPLVRAHFYGPSAAGFVGSNVFVYTHLPPATDVDDDMAAFIQPAPARQLGIAHELVVDGPSYTIKRDESTVVTGAAADINF